MNTKSLTRALLGLFIGLLSISIIWSYVSGFTSHHEIAKEAYSKAFESISKELKPGDIVLIHPPWRHDVIEDLHANIQNSTMSTLVLPTGPVITGRVFVLKDKQAPPLSKRVAQMTSIEPVQLVDEIEIHSLKSTLTESALNFVSTLPLAKVEVLKENGAAIQCKWQNTKRRFTCPGMPNWVYVGPHRMKSGKTQKDCIWSHPAKNATLKIAFPNPPPNSQIRFEHALSTNAIRSDNRSPVIATLFADETKMKRLSRGNQSGFASTTFDLPKKPIQNLTLEITAQKDGARHYCFNLKAETKEAQP